MSSKLKPQPKGLKAKEFRRLVEDFKCFNCKKAIQGNGYTDHCPHCLWSLHVDIMPGDRASPCRGPMKPKYAISERSNYLLVYKCQKCSAEKRVNAAPNDDVNIIFSLARNAMLTSPRA